IDDAGGFNAIDPERGVAAVVVDEELGAEPAVRSEGNALRAIPGRSAVRTNRFPTASKAVDRRKGLLPDPQAHFRVLVGAEPDKDWATGQGVGLKPGAHEVGLRWQIGHDAAALERAEHAQRLAAAARVGGADLD